MYKLVLTFLISMLLLTGCGSMFDASGRGSRDRKIYYDVRTNEIINTYRAPINSMYIWKYIGDSSRGVQRIEFADPVSKLKMPMLQDSIGVYHFKISIHLKDDHWRMMHHIDVTKKLVEKKQKIYSRVTSH